MSHFSPLGALLVCSACGAHMSSGPISVSADAGPGSGPTRRTTSDATRPTEETSAPGDMRVIEAWVGIAVTNISNAADGARKLIAELGGTVIDDEVSYDAELGQLTLRIPPKAVDPLLARLTEIGDLRQRTIRTTDVTAEFLDRQIQLDNLTKALRRYQEILAEAKQVSDLLAVEEQLKRLRGEIEGIKGQMQFLADRVARATIHLTLTLDRRRAEFAPEAKLHPGLRASTLITFVEGERPRTLFGLGLSIHFDRFAHLAIDVLTDSDGNRGEADGFTATLGGDIYSDFLGRGRRTWLNPTLGFRLGLTHLDDRTRLTVGGAAGLEIYKGSAVLVDLTVRGLFLFGRTRPTLALQPVLGANVAF